jgi:hypothetical protein
MQPIFFLIRLPFYLVGAVLVLVVMVPIMVVVWLAWAAWVVFTAPFRLVGAALSNDSKVLTQPFADVVEAVGSFPKEVSDAYSGMTRWLLGK